MAACRHGVVTSRPAESTSRSFDCSRIVRASVEANSASVGAIAPVHPVWWLAAIPRPVSPWKYSEIDRIQHRPQEPPVVG
jgi:hypothetical protein